MQPPSIFNDVIGPVMRGPSSSHCAAALRIGRLALDLMRGDIDSVLVEFDPNGSLATTHESQGSDMGLFGGLLGWEAHDERLCDASRHLKENGIALEIVITDIGATHPNTYKLSLTNAHGTRQIIADSTGGGMIEVISIDGAAVSMAGDRLVTLVETTDPEGTLEAAQAFAPEACTLLRGTRTMIAIEAEISKEDEAAMRARDDVSGLVKLQPVLPVLSRPGLSVPFLTCAEMLNFAKGPNPSLWELAIDYESERGNLSRDEVIEKMRGIVRVMQNSIDEGLRGTEYKDRILGAQSGKLKERIESGSLIGQGTLNQITLFVSAVMEVKSSMGVIVAAPTAGSCGALPGACIGAAKSMGLGEDEIVKAMLAAGLIGVFISAHATFAAEVGGCQAECGAGSGMAAAALVTLAGGTLKQTLGAASMALQNALGLVCDPIANRVEAPCLGRNVMAAGNALTSANMALSDYDHLIPLDEVIAAMDTVGKSIVHELRCTGLGGLSISETSRAIEGKFKGQ